MSAHHAAVDAQALAGYERRVIGREERNGARELVHRAFGSVLGIGSNLESRDLEHRHARAATGHAATPGCVSLGGVGANCGSTSHSCITRAASTGAKPSFAVHFHSSNRMWLGSRPA